MSIENPNIEIEKTTSIYRERAFLSVDEAMDRLKKIQSGEIKPIELSVNEREDIISFENEIGVELEDIDGMKINSAAIYPEHLLTKEGKDLFKSCTGLDVEADDLESVEKFICINRESISNLSGEQLKVLEGGLKKKSEDQILEKLTDTMSDTGQVEISGMENPKSFSFLLDPKVALEKLQKLREFKRKIKELTREESAEGASADVIRVRETILRQYQKRTNELIVEQFEQVVKTKRLADRIGEENLSESEKELLEQFSGMNKFVSIYARFDKFLYGTEDGYDAGRNRIQIGEEIKKYADAMEEKYIENERTKKQKAAEKGLDYKKLTKKNIPKEIFTEKAEAFLDSFGQKSSQPPEEFNPQREGPAPDGKWQYVAGDKYSSMDTDPKQNVITAPARDRSAEELIAGLLGHEFTHVTQTLNQRKMQLRLYNEVCGDRRLILAESGAMTIQNKVSEELFGYSALPKVHYVRAMLKKIEGGDYLECAKEYYDSSLKAYLEIEPNVAGREDFKERAGKLLATALRSAKRLFKSGEWWDSRPGMLTKSKDTVYLEQIVVTEKLKETGLEKFAMVRGLNLDSLFELLETGLIHEADIEMPDMDFIRNVWEEMKKDYALSA